MTRHERAEVPLVRVGRVVPRRVVNGTVSHSQAATGAISNAPSPTITEVHTAPPATIAVIGPGLDARRLSHDTGGRPG